MFVIENSNENKDTPDTDVSRYRKSTFIIQFKGNEFVKSWHFQLKETAQQLVQCR